MWSWLADPIDGRSYLRFRVLICACLLFELIPLFHFRDLCYGAIPHTYRTSPPVGFLLFVWICVVCAMMIGVKVRQLTTVNWLFCVLFFGFKTWSNWHVENVFLSTFLLFMFFPPDRSAMSEIKREGSAETIPAVPRACYLLMLYYAGLVYFDSALWKLGDEMWRSGTAVWATATIPSMSYFDTSWMFPTPWIAKVLCYATLLFELLFIVLFWFRWWKWPLLAVGYLMHLGIAICFPLPLFPALMFCFYSLLPMGTAPPVTTHEHPHQDQIKKKARLAVAVIAAWTLLTLPTLSLCAGLRHYFPKPVESLAPFHNIISPYLSKLTGLTGIQSHEVYTEKLFDKIDSQLRMTYRDEFGEHEIPIVNPSGFIDFRCTNRLWVCWSFYVDNGIYTKNRTDEHLLRFAYFFSNKMNLDSNSGKFILYSRPQTLSLHKIDFDVVQANQNAPWREVGAVLRNAEGLLEVSWLPSTGK